jgi:hypothetical protein
MLKFSSNKHTSLYYIKLSYVTLNCVTLHCIMCVTLSNVEWCLIKRLKVTTQFSDLETTQKSMNVQFDWRLFVLLSPKFSGVTFNGHFQTHGISGSLLCSIFNSLNLFLSVSLSLSFTWFPLYFYLLLFHVNSLMILISSIIE